MGLGEEGFCLCLRHFLLAVTHTCARFCHISGRFIHWEGMIHELAGAYAIPLLP